MTKSRGMRKQRRRFWTPDENKRFRKLYADTSTDEMTRTFRRTVRAIYTNAKSLGLTKSPEYMAGLLAEEGERLKVVGAASRYQPGRTPENKGLRRPGWAPGRMRETWFKPGVRQGIAAKNWQPIGTVKADSEGFLRKKVCEGVKGEPYGFGSQKIWPFVHKMVWAKANGPIPAGHLLRFRDGDRSNCALENLELISRADNMRRNSIHNLPPKLKQVIHLKGAVRRAITIRTRKQDAKEQTGRPA